MTFYILLVFSVGVKLAQAISPGIGECTTETYTKDDGTKACGILLQKGLTWYQADTECRRLGARLPEIRSEKENNDLMNLKPPYAGPMANGMWLGATDEVTEGVFLWNQQKDPLTYQNWESETGFDDFKSVQPDNFGKEDCLQMSFVTGKWSDFRCDYTKVPQITICEKMEKGPGLSNRIKNSTNACTTGYYRKSDGTRVCGFFLKRGLTWHQALAECTRQGGRLPEVRTLEDNMQLLNIKPPCSGVFPDGMWLGATDIMNEGTFVWEHQRDEVKFQFWDTGPAMGFENFNSSQPDNFGDENCLQMWMNNGRWNDLRCDYTKVPQATLCEIVVKSNKNKRGEVNPSIKCRSHRDCVPGAVCLHSTCSILPCFIDSRNCPDGLVCVMETKKKIKHTNNTETVQSEGICRGERLENLQTSAIRSRYSEICARQEDCPKGKKCFMWTPLSSVNNYESYGVCKTYYSKCATKCGCKNPELICSGPKGQEKFCFCTHTDDKKCDPPCDNENNCPNCQTCASPGICKANLVNKSCNMNQGTCPRSPKEICLMGRTHQCCSDCDCSHRSRCLGSYCDPCTRTCQGNIPWYCNGTGSVCKVDNDCLYDEVCVNFKCLFEPNKFERNTDNIKSDSCNPSCKEYEMCVTPGKCVTNPEMSQASLDSTCGSYRMNQHIMEEAKYFYNHGVNKNCHHYLPLPPWFNQPPISNIPTINGKRANCPSILKNNSETYPCSCDEEKPGKLSLNVGLKPINIEETNENSQCPPGSRPLEIYCLQQWKEVKKILTNYNKGYSFFWTGMKLKVDGRKAKFIYRTSGAEAPFGDFLFPPPLEESCVQIEYVKSYDDWKMSTRNCMDTEPALICEQQSTEMINGNWGSWTETSPCSSSCGEGQKILSRKCDSPVPQQGGSQCEGSSSKTISCNNGMTCQNGTWGSWTETSACSSSCGEGKKVLSRKCNSPALLDGASQCDESTSRTVTCNYGIPCPKFSKALVVGGWIYGSTINSPSVEIIDLVSSTTVCQPIPNFAFPTRGALGGLIDDSIPMVCGGLADVQHQNLCYYLKNGTWIPGPSLTVPRYHSAGISLFPFNNGYQKFFVTGGYNPLTSELFDGNKWSSSYMPIFQTPLYVSCLSYGHESTIMITGGIYDPLIPASWAGSTQTLTLNQQNMQWDHGPALAQGRYGHGCGTIASNGDGAGMSIIVAGGLITNKFQPIATVEILDKGSMAWRPGPSLPVTIGSASLVTDPLEHQDYYLQW